MLAGGEVVPGTHDTWRDLVSALQRHTVHSELAQLSKDDRQLLSLAYLSGHTNREIAAMLNVSVRTVSRRLTAALARFEESARRVGAWVSILGLAIVAWSARLAGAARSDRMPAAALVAAGTASVVAVGFVVATPRTPMANGNAPSAQARTVPMDLPSVAGIDIVPASVVTELGLVPAPPDKTNHSGGNSAGAQQTGGTTSSRVCGGNPTNAPPVTPVGHRPGNPPPQPVTHPGAHNGGCGHH